MDISFWAKFCNLGLLIVVPIITVVLGIGSLYFNAQIKKIDDLIINQQEEKIQELTVKAKELSRGITSFYDYNGTKRETASGSNIAIMGKEYETFQKMDKLMKERKLDELIKIAEEQINENQEWLTPYFFLGIAYADLDQKEKAIKNLEYVSEKAPNDRNYKAVKHFLERLKGN